MGLPSAINPTYRITYIRDKMDNFEAVKRFKSLRAAKTWASRAERSTPETKEIIIDLVHRNVNTGEEFYIPEVRRVFEKPITTDDEYDEAMKTTQWRELSDWQ